MSSTVATPGMDLSDTFAPFFWGFFVSMFLGGITIVQAYLYFPHPSDRTSVQVLAAIMIILDLLSSALVAQSVYYYLIPHFGSLEPLDAITPELSVDCLISGILTFISQMYFVHQIYTFKHTGVLAWTIIAVVAMFAILTFAGGIACVATMYIFSHGILAVRSRGFSIAFGLAKGFGAVTDILVTLAMCTILTNARTGMKRTDNLIKNLIQYLVTRGAVVTLVQTLLFISFFAFPNRLYWLAFHINVTKLYANTFFCMLNARTSLWEKHSHSTVVDIPTVGSSTVSNGSDFRNKITSHGQAFSLNTFRSQDRKDLPDMPTITKSVIVA